MDFGKAGLIVICRRTKKVALIKGVKSQRWGFPKGDVDNRESLKYAAVREFKEEIGHEIKNVADNVSLKVKGQPDKIFFISIVEESFDMKIQESEVSEAKWINLKGISNTDQNYTYDVRLLSKILAGYSKIREQIRLKNYIEKKVY